MERVKKKKKRGKSAAVPHNLEKEIEGGGRVNISRGVKHVVGSQSYSNGKKENCYESFLAEKKKQNRLCPVRGGDGTLFVWAV